MESQQRASEAEASTHALQLTPALARQLKAVTKVSRPSAQHALQIVALQARVWAADENDSACRPWYILCLELYPRGKVINHMLGSPPSRCPSAADLFTFLLDHIEKPPEGELSVLPSHVSFVDEAVTAAVAPHLARLRVRCETLTLADGVMDYIKRFSTKMVERGRATRSNAAERPGLLSVGGVTPAQISLLMEAAVAMHNTAPWTRIPEHVALQIRLPSHQPHQSYRQRFYVTILGSDEKVYGFALVASLAMLRDKYRRVMSNRTGNGGIDVKPIASDVYVCAACGRRVGENGPGSERWVNRCTGCRRLLYCDEECQRVDWRMRHMRECHEAKDDPDYVFRREQWEWLDRELALLFLDPTAIPFDDLDSFSTHRWKFINDQSPPLYPLGFVSVQASDGVTSRRDLPTADEINTMTLVAQGLTECVSTPPSDSILHLANGVSISLAENLAESIPVPSS